MEYIIYTQRNFLAIKKNKVMSFAGKRLEWAVIKLNQSPEDNCYMFSLIYGF